MLCPRARAKIRAWIEAYDKLQSLAVVLLYFQVACALIGSLGAFYTGIILVNLAVALFALVAIESGSQTLCRTYAALLACELLLDIVWFVLFSVEIGKAKPNSNFGRFSAFSLQLVLWMEIVGFALRIFSSFLWLQMYRLGVSSDQGAVYQPVDFEGRIGALGLFSPSSPRTSRQSSLSDEVLGGSIYNPAYYSSLFTLPVNEDAIQSQVATTDPLLASQLGFEDP